MVSKEDCERQSIHTDFNPKAINVNKARACIISIQPGTTLDVVDKGGSLRTIHLEPGDAVFFKGGCQHAGSAYKNVNSRLHYFLDIRGTRKHNTTYFVDASGKYQSLSYSESLSIKMNEKKSATKLLNKMRGALMREAKLNKMASFKGI